MKSNINQVEEIDSDETERILTCAAAVDVAKASGMVCVRCPHPSIQGRRTSRVWEVESTTNSILSLGADMVALGVERVVLESTSDYWRPFFYLLEAAGLSVWLVNARDVKQVTGRPKTDKLDAVWLAKLCERGMLRASFVPPAEIRVLRDYTRLRTDLVQERTRHKQRLEKLLEDALLTELRQEMRWSDCSAPAPTRSTGSPVASSNSSPNSPIPRLPGTVRPGPPPARDVPVDDAPNAGRLSTVERLDEIPGIAERAAQIIIAEVGLNMAQFPTPAHLVSWAKLSPQSIQSGPKTKVGKTGKGNRYLKGVLGEAATAAAKTNTFLGERYRRLVRRRGKQRALVAVARSILVIVWHLLNDPDARYVDLGSDYHTSRLDPDRKTRDLVRQLHALGHTVTLTPAA